MTDNATSDMPTAVSVVVSIPELVGLIIAHSSKRSLLKLRLVSRLFSQACHPYFSVPLISNNPDSHWGKSPFYDAPGHLIQSVCVAQYDAKYCSIIQSTFTALEHLEVYVTNSPTAEPSTAATSHMNLDPLFSSGSALEHRLNQVTITIMAEQDGEWDPWFLTGTHRDSDSSERTVFSQVTTLEIRTLKASDRLWVRWATIDKLMRDVFPNLERLTFSRIKSSDNYTLGEYTLEREGGFIIDGVASVKLTHLDLTDMSLSMEAICRLNTCFPNLERLAVRGFFSAQQTLGQQNPAFVATPLTVKSFQLQFGTVDDVLMLLPLLDKVVDLALLDLSRGSPTDLVDGFSKIAGRNRFKQLTFTGLMDMDIMNREDTAALFQIECFQSLERLTLRCHPSWVFLDLMPGTIPPAFLSTLEHLEFQRLHFSSWMSVKDAVKFNAMLNTMHRLKQLIVRTPVDGFELFEGLGHDKTRLSGLADGWNYSQAWSHCLRDKSTGPWLETIEIFISCTHSLGIEPEEVEEFILDRFSPWLEKVTISLYSDEPWGPSVEEPLEILQQWGDATTEKRVASDGVQVLVEFRY
ncbi:hypothetical protein BGZ96_011155 [Linnemannia gamsii]|uniref:F-box domain-containing protein n=1 Tax=Linnemannia gamsii TaxID=64522 RepID=A0ABQ7JTI6_9FUNG|nr:hypothetical protein BGZ96_011155 [Linnemannia gamsii]